ncbi:MAG TPA: hypothetical protein VFK56_15580, partial [Mycobacterium sp.]|nr:hypothetical protein [Mycobacterium sp.]
FLPPLPPLPPFPFSAQVSGALNNVRDGLRDPVLGVLQQLSDRLPSHDPEPPPPAPVVTTAVERGFTTAGTNLTAQVSSVPKAVANALKRAAGAEDTTEAIVPDVPRAPRNTRQGVTSLIATPGSVVKGAVQSKRQVKAAATETTGDDSTVGPRRRVGDAGGNIATTVKKRVTDTASTVKKVSDDTRKSMKKAKSDSG